MVSRARPPHVTFRPLVLMREDENTSSDRGEGGEVVAVHHPAQYHLQARREPTTANSKLLLILVLCCYMLDFGLWVI